MNTTEHSFYVAPIRLGVAIGTREVKTSVDNHIKSAFALSYKLNWRQKPAHVYTLYCINYASVVVLIPDYCEVVNLRPLKRLTRSI